MNRNEKINYILNHSELYCSTEFKTMSDDRLVDLFIETRARVRARNDAASKVANKPEWFVVREFDGAMLTKKNGWKCIIDSPDDLKMFKRVENAIKFGLDHKPGTAYAVYPGDTIGLGGNVTHASDAERAAASYKLLNA